MENKSQTDITLYSEATVFPGYQSDSSTRVRSLSFSECGQFLITSNTNDNIEIFDVDLGIQRCFLRSRKYGNGIVRFTNSTNRILQTSSKIDNTIRMIDLEREEYLSYFSGHTDKVTSLNTIPNVATVVSASNDGTVKLWDYRTAKCINQIKLSGEIISCVDPNGYIVAAGFNSELIKLFDTRMDDNHLVEYKIGTYRSNFRSIQFSPDGKYLGIGTDDIMTHLVDTYNGDIDTFRSK